MKTISQRELRNDNAEIVRAVEQGESYVVTRRGVPVARLGPMDEGAERPARPARHRPVFSTLTRVTSAVPTSAVLDDLRGDR